MSKKYCNNIFYSCKNAFFKIKIRPITINENFFNDEKEVIYGSTRP